MDDNSLDDGGARDRPDADRGFRLHLFAYASVNGVLFLIDLITPGSWWIFWPVVGWGIALAAHWLYVKSLNIGEEWADQRAEDVRLRAYDISHMLDIQKRRAARKRPRPPTENPRD